MSEAQVLEYRDAELYLEETKLSDLAQQFGTPLYVYSERYITERTRALQNAFTGIDFQLHYSVKANSNIHILKLFERLGVGFDIVSGGELQRVLTAGGHAKHIIFSGVGKRVDEIDMALKLGIECFNVESIDELQRISARAENLQTQGRVSLRVNPNVDAQTHPYISTGLKENKFGIPIEHAREIYQRAHNDPNLTVVGIDCHIGSQITELSPLLEATQHLIALQRELQQDGIEIQHIDLGGGMGICYDNEIPLDFDAYGSAIQQLMGHDATRVLLEPGRSLVANAGVLLTHVEYLKPATEPDHPNFAVVDAAMNDLIRPALYNAHHAVSTCKHIGHEDAPLWNIVGPICESGDFLAHQRQLALAEDSLLCVHSAGAYGMVQASNYNTRGRAAEVLVNGDQATLIRRRENIDDLLRFELEVHGSS